MNTISWRKYAFSLTSLLLLFVTPVLAADGGDSKEERLAAAQRYLTFIRFREVNRAFPSTVVQRPPAPADSSSELYAEWQKKEESIKRFHQAERELFDIDALERGAAESLARLFTAGELDAVVRFYLRPAGAAYRKKWSEYNKRFRPVFDSELRKHAIETPPIKVIPSPSNSGQKQPPVR